MINSSYKFKEINGRLIIEDDTLKDQSNTSSFKYYNKFIGFFLRLICKAENFTAQDIHGNYKCWVVNSNSFKNWKARLPEGNDLDSRIKLMIKGVRKEQDHLKDVRLNEAQNLKDTKLEESKDIVPENKPDTIDELEQLLPQNEEKNPPLNNKSKQNELPIEKNDANDIVPEEQSKEKKAENFKATIQPNKDISQVLAKFNQQAPDWKKKPIVLVKKESVKVVQADKQEKVNDSIQAKQAEISEKIEEKMPPKPAQIKRKTPLREITRVYLKSINATYDDALYFDKLFYEIIKNPTVKSIESLKSKNGKVPKMVYNFFTSSIELKKLEENGIISKEIKEKLFKQALLKEEALSFAKGKRKANFKEDFYLGTITNRILGYARFEQEPFKCIEEILKNAKEKKIKGQTERKMAYDFFISSVEKLEEIGIISPKVKEKLNQGIILKKNALAFARSHQLANFNEDLYFRKIINDIISHPGFLEEPLETVMDNQDDAEGKMVREFFTNPVELEKLENAKIISTEVKQKLLKQ